MREDFESLKKEIELEKKIVREMVILLEELKTSADPDEKRITVSQINELREYFRAINKKAGEFLDEVGVAKQIAKTEIPAQIKKPKLAVIQKHPELKLSGKIPEDFELSELEKITLKRLKEIEKKQELKKLKKPSLYIQLSNKLFFNLSERLIHEPFFNSMRRDIIKSNLDILPRSYISVMLFTTLISIFVAVFAILFFMFFNFGVDFPFITKASESAIIRFAKTFWLLIAIPLATFFMMYVYPNLEKKSDEAKINQEIPFATIHMSAVSGSMVDPTKIFSILVSTGDYPNISKQFTKLLNRINLQGYSLVNALRATAFNGPSDKLAELMNGLATTITSGGDLPNFFEKRAETLMLDYRLEKEKYAKTAETFMDIYISVVIAAPMILMLLLIMMNISGIGIGLSTGMISLIMSLGVGIINFAFLMFLQLKGAASGA